VNALIGKLRALLNKQKIRFLIVGGFNTVFGYVAFVIVHGALGALFGYLAALILAHLCSSTAAYYLYRVFVFTSGDHGFRAYAKFQSVYLVPLFTNLVVLPILVEWFSWPVLAAQAAFSLSWVGISYLAHRDYTFRSPRKK
jgi:putative flippase GtrA